MTDRLAAPLARFLLVTVATLQIIWFGAMWYWVALTMVIGVLGLEVLRKERAAVLEIGAGAAGEEDEADDRQRGQ